jgi:hypothetical protein
MKQILFIVTFFITAISFAQRSSSITGNVLDIESNNRPLLYAKVLIKETGAEVLSDEKGFFKFENLKYGNYTLVSSFVGYETKELKVKVESEDTILVKVYLGASSISLDQLMLVIASNDK